MSSNKKIVDTPFVDATAVKQLSPHTYEANFPDDWCIGTVPHGGFVTSTFLNVAHKHFSTTLSKQSQPNTITLHLDFLRRTNSGPALFTVRDVKLGRQTSIIHITLTQGSSSSPREEVVGYITNTNLSTESGVSLPTGWELNPSPPPVNLQALEKNEDEFWARQGDMPFKEFRKASQKVDFHFPKGGQVSRNIADQWLCFRDEKQRFTDATLGFLADMFPMPVEAFLGDENPYDISSSTTSSSSSKPTSSSTTSSSSSSPSSKKNQKQRRAAKYWYPTLLLNLDIKKSLPPNGVRWLFSRCLTKKIQNGRTDIEVIIYDEGGDIVALSHHVTFVLGAERNLSERRKNDGGGDSKI